LINQYCRRKDHIEVANGWKLLGGISAEEGLISIGYDRPVGEYSRLWQFVKFYLFCSSACIYDCPLAMTDGAARLIELNLDSVKDEAIKTRVRDAYAHFLSRDPAKFWTSGQWMTERTGGSDVGPSETVAVPNQDGSYSITGFKFFTSATTSNCTFLLARIVDTKTVSSAANTATSSSSASGIKGTSVSGSRGLSVFFLEIRKENGDLNNIVIHRLKNKMGTKAVPTAELELCGARAYLVGEPNSGVKVISSILNITRIHNAVSMTSLMRRGVAVARDFASRRSVFGKLLQNQPLHLSTLADMEAEVRGGQQITFDVVMRLGKAECDPNVAVEDQVMLRLLTPIMKLYTAKQAIAMTSESIESLGGTGYMEDSDMPRLLRDAQVGSIWEGTTNVLSMDVWRPALKENALQYFVDTVTKKVSTATSGSNQPQELAGASQEILRALSALVSYAKHVGGAGNMVLLEANARYFAMALGRVYIATLMLEQAAWSVAQGSNSPTDSKADIAAARYWIFRKPLVDSMEHPYSAAQLDSIASLAMDHDPKTGKPRGVGDVDARKLPRAKY
jgi:alkylation response protein AidB-like acyl-CoA dehydrogenase